VRAEGACIETTAGERALVGLVALGDFDKLNHRVIAVGWMPSAVGRCIETTAGVRAVVGLVALGDFDKLNHRVVAVGWMPFAVGRVRAEGACIETTLYRLGGHRNAKGFT